MTLEEIKMQVASDDNFKSWQLLFESCAMFDYGRLESAIDKVALRFAQSQTQEIKEQNAELVDMYKECFEMFIPSDKWDEATEFLSTYGSGLAKDLCKKEKHNHLNKKP